MLQKLAKQIDASLLNKALIDRFVLHDSYRVISLLGRARTGKTAGLMSLAKQWSQKHPAGEIWYIDFAAHNHLTLEDVFSIYHNIRSEQAVVLLDNLHVVNNWEMVLPQWLRTPLKWLISADSGALTSKQHEWLRRETQVIEVNPLNFREFLLFQGISLQPQFEFTAQRKQVYQQVQKFFHQGGYPELISENELSDRHRQLAHLIFFRDIVARHHIRNHEALMLLVNYLSVHTGTELSFNYLKNYCKSHGLDVSTATLIDYVQVLQEEQLLFKLPNYRSVQVQRELKSRFFFFDTALLQAFYQPEEAVLLNNAVASYFRQAYGSQVYFYRHAQQVDFYVPDTAWVRVIASPAATTTNWNDHYLALIHAARELSVPQLIVLNPDEESVTEVEGYIIRLLPVWKLLLNGLS